MKCDKHNIEMLEHESDYPGKINFVCPKCDEENKEIGQKYLEKIDKFLRERDSIKQYQILPEWFPKAMDEILVEKNAEKEVKWPDISIHTLLVYLDNQVLIIQNMLDINLMSFSLSPPIIPDKEDVIRHCIYAANFAMMIADNIKRKMDDAPTETA